MILKVSKHVIDVLFAFCQMYLYMYVSVHTHTHTHTHIHTVSVIHNDPEKKDLSASLDMEGKSHRSSYRT